MARFDGSTTIKRPIEDVFAVLSDFSNGSRWAAGVAEPAVKTSDGPIGVGTTWRGSNKAMGRKFEIDVRYTEYEPDRRIVFTTTKPFPVTVTVKVEPVGGGTRVTQTVEGQPGGFFKLAEPLVVKMTKRQFQNDLDNLRDLMEANAL
jgi:uncharacterized protein YndB with AHSA1/START domain